VRSTVIMIASVTVHEQPEGLDEMFRAVMQEVLEAKMEQASAWHFEKRAHTGAARL
jgi:hypothetical protein